MISYLEGKIVAKEKNSLILAVNGIGYEVRVTPGLFLQSKIGEQIKIFTYFHIREDAQELYGVTNFEELNFFKQLVSINGIGPKSVLNILALGSIAEIKKAISSSDVTFLTKVSGIGRKIADRIIVELKDKLEKVEIKSGEDSSNLGDVIDALTGLGYSLNEARVAIKQVKEIKNTSIALKEALKILNKRDGF